MSVVTIEQAAQERQRAAEALQEASAEVERLHGPYRAACDRQHEAKERLKEIDAAMAAVALNNRVREAVAASGIEYDGPCIVAWEVYSSRYIAHLIAIGPEGTGLFINKPERAGRYGGAQRVVRAEDAAKHGVVEPPYEGSHYERTGENQKAAGLFAWQARGKGDFGFSGPYKPLAPPEGGRWRWLKIKDGKELTA